MDFFTAFTTGFSKFATFSGRASRSEFWFFHLGTVLVAFGIGMASAMLAGPSSRGDASALWSLMIMLPSLAITVRRLHDINRSGWLLLVFQAIVVLAFILAVSSNDRVSMIGGLALAGSLLTAVYFLAEAGTPGPNQYGEDPLASNGAQPSHLAIKSRINPATENNLEVLERLHSLLQKGALTQLEFEREKKRVLGG